MKIYLKTDMMFAGVHVDAGMQVEVEDGLANLLLGTDRASKEPIVVTTVADPLATGADSTGTETGTEADKAKK